MTRHVEIKTMATSAAQASPSLTAIWMWLSGKPIDFWVAASGFVFIWLQVAYMLWRWRRDARREAQGQHPVVDDYGDEVGDGR